MASYFITSPSTFIPTTSSIGFLLDGKLLSLPYENLKVKRPSLCQSSLCVIQRPFLIPIAVHLYLYISSYHTLITFVLTCLPMYSSSVLKSGIMSSSSLYFLFIKTTRDVHDRKYGSTSLISCPRRSSTC